MKINQSKNRLLFPASASGHKSFLTAALMAILAGTAMADQVIIESFNPDGTHNTSANYSQTVGTWSGSGSSAKSTAPGLTGTKSTFGFAATPTLVIKPHLAVSGGVYTLEITYTASSNTGSNLVVGMSSPDCDFSTNQTSGFQSRTTGVLGANQWYKICTITNHAGVTDPAVTLAYLSGTLAATGGRLWTDGYRFTSALDLCAQVPQLSTVNGPLAAGQNFVNVPGISTNATLVTVYADSGSGGVQIGSLAVTNKTSAVVPVTNLVRGNFITAVQTIGGNQACPFAPGAGQEVGAGPNSHIRFALNLAQDPALQGPIGANGNSASAVYYFIPASGKIGTGFGTAPNGGVIINPSTCWQTVSIDPTYQTASEYFWNVGSTNNPDTNAFAQLDAIAIAIDDLTDTGPYEIFIDNLMNGDTLIEGFETPTNGTSAYGFAQPSFAGTSSTFLLAQSPGSVTPNVSIVTTNHADVGNQSLRVSWQWKDVNPSDWVRLVATNHPMVDLTKPITFRVLVLPVGVTNGDLSVSALSNQVQNAGGSATFSVTTKGAGPFTYQWFFNDTTAITGATSSTYTQSNLTTNDAGRYSVAVTDTNGCANVSAAMLTVNTAIVPVNITVTAGSSSVVLNWTGSHTLQMTTNLLPANTVWTDVNPPVLTGPYTNSYSGVACFFRLKN